MVNRLVPFVNIGEQLLRGLYKLQDGKAVLEVFGDDVVGFGVLQELRESIRCLFDQQGALCVLRGQRTPHNFQVLW